MAGIDGWLAQKYQIQGEQADAARRLSDAQAQNITASTPFENRLRAAQAFQTNEQGKTLGPLAGASIDATHAGINETQARTGLFGAQADLTGAQTKSTYDDLSAVPDGALSGLYRRLQQTYSPNGASSTSPVGGGPTHFEGLSILTPPVSPKPVITAPGVGQNSNPADPNVVGGVQKLATGTDNVKPLPAPGQTITGGTWTPPPPPFDPRAATGIRGVPRPAPTPPVAYAKGTSNVKPATDNIKVQGVQNVEMGPGYAKGKSKVPSRGGGHMAPPMVPQGMPMGMPAGAPAPGQMGAAMPGAGASPPNGLPGLAGMLQAAMGSNQVPGQGTGDTVPAMLTPGEAVVNKGGIAHIPGGRPAIAAANAKGNAMKPSMGRGMVKKPPGHNHVAVHIKMA